MRYFSKHRWLIVVIFVWLLTSLPSLTQYPAVSGDEGQFSAVGWNFIQSGSFNSPLSSQLKTGNVTGIYHGRLYALLLGLDFWLFGVGVDQARWSSMLGALAAGVLVWRAAKQLRLPAPFCLIATALFVFSWKAFISSHRARPDIWLAASGVLVMWLYMRAQRFPDNPRNHFILGFVSAYLIDLHALHVYFTAIVVALVLANILRNRIPWRAGLAFLTGTGLGVVAWLAMWLLPDPALALQKWKIFNPAYHPAFELVSHPAVSGQAKASIDWFLATFVRGTPLTPIETALTALAILGMGMRRNESDRFLLTWLALLFGVFLAAPYLHPWHAVIVTPFASLALARGAEILYAHNFPGPSCVRWAGILCAIGLAAASLAGNLVLSSRAAALSYTAYAHELMRFVPAGHSIIGEPDWWFAFHNGIFTSDLYVSDKWRTRRDTLSPEGTVAAVLADRRVEYVLIDERLGSAWQEPMAQDEATLFDAYTRVVSTNCQLAGKVALPFYGVDQGGPGVKQTTIWKCQ